ncbi:hypothetical protein N8J89_07480 [Crossiella sp. CA-258035]|uniref:hypothetical protein n=1 Tax=Crossiella sp. CA-258035 TaxID=2981138 RepID=UPI0024BC8D20|nr:hypothetical protein [Crossiella sp. CA-258035]WHT20898.1 hypothetical protein N8J89_07480 [Crossiella sp. CA-258035]
MSPKKGDPVAPPAIGAEWQIRFSTTEAVKGWQDLENTAPGNLRKAWETMRAEPGPGPGKPTSRHHQLRRSLATGSHGGRTLPQWQIEVTGGGRIWYLLDEDRHTVWVQAACAGHPKATD